MIRVVESKERSVLPVSVYLEKQYGVNDVVMSVPCVIGRGEGNVFSITILPMQNWLP